MTTYSDDFNKANSATVGATLTFTDVVGDLQNVSNRAEVIVDSATGRSRAEHDTTTNDQYGEIIVAVAAPSTATNLVGVCLRYSAAADTCYRFTLNRTSSAATLVIAKVVAGAVTTLASGSTSIATGDTIRAEVVGTTLTGYRNGTQVVTVTDSAIATGKRFGINIFAAEPASVTTSYVDSLTAGDLARSLIPDERRVRRNVLLRR